MNAVTKALGIQHAASCRFEAARQITGSQIDHRSNRMHGHGFIVSAHACLPDGWSAYSGGEVSSLRSSLERCSNILDYCFLNEIVENPTDANLAKWFVDQLNVPGLSRISVQSTPDQGVIVENAYSQVWRRYRFQAAHKLPNVPEGHKCGRLHGHGFQVILHAASDVSSSSVAVEYDSLDAGWEQVFPLLNYRYLNDLPGLENPTSELISSWLWGKLKPDLPCLSAVTVYETESCGATFDGATYRIWKDFNVDSAVRHGNAVPGALEYNLHGYTYKLRLRLCGSLDSVMGWTVDFGDVKAIFDPIFKSIDHHPLHEQAALVNGDSATIAKWLYGVVKEKLPELEGVDLFEVEGCGALVGQNVGAALLPV